MQQVLVKWKLDVFLLIFYPYPIRTCWIYGGQADSRCGSFGYYVMFRGVGPSGGFVFVELCIKFFRSSNEFCYRRCQKCPFFVLHNIQTTTGVFREGFRWSNPLLGNFFNLLGFFKKKKSKPLLIFPVHTKKIKTRLEKFALLWPLD